MVVDLVALDLDELRPLLAVGRHAVEPGLVEFVAEVFVDELLARHAIAVAQAHEAAFETDQALVDGVELLDQAFDTVVVQGQRFDVEDDFIAQLVVSLLLLARALLARDLLFELLVLLLPELLVGAGDLVEGFEHLRLQFGFHGGQGHGVLEVVLVLAAHFAFGRRRARARHGSGAGAVQSGLADRGRGLRLGTLVGRFEIDDVAE